MMNNLQLSTKNKLLMPIEKDQISNEIWTICCSVEEWNQLLEELLRNNQNQSLSSQNHLLIKPL